MSRRRIDDRGMMLLCQAANMIENNTPDQDALIYDASVHITESPGYGKDSIIMKGKWYHKSRQQECGNIDFRGTWRENKNITMRGTYTLTGDSHIYKDAFTILLKYLGPGTYYVTGNYLEGAIVGERIHASRFWPKKNQE